VNTEVRDLVQLSTTYKDKWENEFGNVSNERLEEMWSDIFNTLSEVQRRNFIRRTDIEGLDKEPPLNVVYSSTMGTGKSTTVQHYLKYGLDTKFFKALVVVELIATCDEYEEILKDRGAVAVHSDNGRRLEDNLDAPILIITHNRLVQLLNKGVSDEVFDEYDLVVIDEQVSTYQHIHFTYKEINTYLKSLLGEYYEGPIAEFGEFFLSSASEIKRVWEDKNDIQPVNKTTLKEPAIVDWSLYADDLEEKIPKLRGLNRSEYLKLEAIVNKLRIGSKQGRLKLLFWQQDKQVISFNVVIDYLPIHISKVMFDGTASVNDTYKLINKHIGEGTIEVREYHKLRSFKNATIKWYKTATGKSSLTASSNPISQKKKYEQEVLDVDTSLDSLVHNTISRYGKEERVLFIVHKDNAEILEDKIKDTNYSVTYWGKHVGSNEWKDCSKIVVYGLNFFPENVYSAIYYSTYGANTELGIHPINDLKAGLLTVDILQGIFRGQLRTVSDKDSNCPIGTEVILSLPNDPIHESILKRMKVVLHDATFEEIQDGAEPIKANSANTKKMQELIKVLSGENLYRGKSSYIEKRQIEITPQEINYTPTKLRDLLVRGKYVHHNLSVLADAGWEYKHISKEEATRAGIKCGNRGTYVFKYIGSFEDEYIEPTLDTNGNEY